MERSDRKVIGATSRFLRLPAAQSYNTEKVNQLTWHLRQMQAHGQAAAGLRRELGVAGRPKT